MSNSAIRIAKILDAFNGSKQTVLASRWHEALFDGVGDRDEHALSVALIALRNELTELGDQLERSGIEHRLWHPKLLEINHLTKVESLARSIPPSEYKFNSDSLVVMHWIGLYLGPSGSDELSAEAEKEILKLIKELKAALAMPGVTPRFYAYAKKVLQELEDAISLQRIQGTGPVAEAVKHAVVNAAFADDALKAEMSATEVAPDTKQARQKLGAVLSAAAKSTGDAEKTVSSYKALLSQAYAAGQFLIDAIS